jgi:hypothetical protein
MAVDNDKLSYFSAWDIDQLVATAEVAVSAGTTMIYDIPDNLPLIPEWEVQFKPGASTVWFQTGPYSTNPGAGTIDSFSSYVQAGQLYITTSTNGIARYYVWADKVDY